MDHKRFLIAILLSAVILFSWQYFFAPVPEQNDNGANIPQEPRASIQLTPNSSPAPQTNISVPAQTEASRRTIIVDTPLFKATFDSRGAIPTSWIIKKNKDSEREIFSVGEDLSRRLPLELISAKGLESTPRETPLQIVTRDASLDLLLNERDYSLVEANADGINAFNLQQGENHRLSFVLRDESSGVVATKTYGFNADDYIVKMEVSVSRSGGDVLPAELSIGPSIGDQGIRKYTFYSVAPESVFDVGGEATRETGSSVIDNGESSEKSIVKGPINWAGSADTYFAMVVVPTQAFPQIRLQSVKYGHTSDDNTKEDRFLLSSYVPIPSNGLVTNLYVGPKDHYILADTSKELTSSLGRQINLDGLIDYGWFSSISRPLAIPILSAIKFFNKLTGNYGVAIIIFTFIIYSLFFPLKWRSSKSMKKAQKLAPRMKEVQEKIKTLKPSDPRLKELQMEQLRLMKDGNMLGGCLPLLIQMPFFFALYRAITISLDFRQATFLWLPDLSAGDPIHLLPLLMAASVLVVQLITPAPSADPMQRKMMAFMMPAIMLYALWSAPAGLLLYWLVGNIIIFCQQIIINRLIATKGDEDPPQLGATRQMASA
jgi:YidC/Oxa1 family membrane protein insertase